MFFLAQTIFPAQTIWFLLFQFGVTIGFETNALLNYFYMFYLIEYVRILLHYNMFVPCFCHACITYSCVNWYKCHVISNNVRNKKMPHGYVLVFENKIDYKNCMSSLNDI